MNVADIVVVGAGPVGLWSAIQLKKRLPGAQVRVYERHVAYQRAHVLRLDHWSLLLYAAADGSPAEQCFVQEVTGKSLTAMRTRFAESLYIRTNEFEAALQRYAQALGIELRHVRIDGTRHARDLHPECSLFIAADGAHSALRTELFGSEALASTTLQHVLELKCEERVEARVDTRADVHAGQAAPRLATSQLWQLNRSLHHTASEHVGRVRDGMAPVTLRLFLDAATYRQLPAMSFKAPYLLDAAVASGEALPAAVRHDLQAFLAARQALGAQHVAGSARLTKLELNMYAARHFATVQGEAAWFLVGDAALGVPYFRALNSGLMLGSRLAHLIAGTDALPAADLAHKVHLYDKRCRPQHVATEFAIARSKNWLVDGVHSAREWFAQPAAGEEKSLP
jgi:2-polyprenyl-6-methoxyphenol hydroxylase-like FAD-dependent oxidoreductase